MSESIRARFTSYHVFSVVCYNCQLAKYITTFTMDPRIIRFYDEIRNILGNQQNLDFIQNRHGCVKWSGPYMVKNGVKYGYKYIKLPHQQRKSRQYVHRLAYMLKIGRYQLPRAHDVSHLCHNSLCVNSAHLVLEPHDINNTRIHCVKTGECHGHQQYKDCLL